MESLFRIFFTRHHSNRTTKRILSTLSLCSAVFTGAVFAVPDVYNPQTSFLKSVPLPANKSAAEVERAYLGQIVDQTYTTQCGGSKCVSEGANRLTFAKWQELNGFTKDNTTTVRYYNSADLGLGRDMNCVSIPGDLIRGKDAMSCYVSNHGTLGGGAKTAFDALDRINAGNNPSIAFATVAMEIRPAAPVNKVRFFVFGADGLLVNANGGDNIVLDSGTGHSQPGVCMNCHGGKFTDDGAVNNAHFLPFDFASLEFKNETDRTNAISKINTLNELIRNAEKSAYSETDPAKDPTINEVDYSRLRIVNYINAEYGQAVGAGSESRFSDAIPARAMKDTYVEPSFQTSTNNQLLYKSVTRNYCRTCHLAVDRELEPSDIARHVCRTSGMPQAEVNAKNLLRHMNEIAAIIYQTTGNTDCFKMPVLEDFQWGAAESKNISMSSSLAIDDSSIKPESADKTNGFAVEFQAKRVLKLNAQSAHGFVALEAPKINGQYLRSISALSFLAPPLPGDNSTMIRADLYDAQGALVGNVSSYIDTDAKNFSISAPLGSPFKKYTANLAALGFSNISKVELHLKRTTDQITNGAFIFSTPLELDDISVNYTQPTDLGQKILAIEDFEDQAFGFPNSALPLGSLGVRTAGMSGTAIDGGCPPSGSAIKGFNVSAVRKVERDSGRYSFVSNPVFCAGQGSIVWVRFQSPGVNNKGRSMSFDFTIDRQGDGKPVGVLDNGLIDVLELAQHQGTVTATDEKFSGHVVINLDTISENVMFDWIPLVNSGVSGAPVRGISLDNFTLWDAPL